MRRRLLLPIAMLAGFGLVAAGCGSSGSSSSSSAPQSTPTTNQPTQTSTGGTSGSGSVHGSISAGKSVFASNCGSCHTLKDAGTNGTLGPDLDSLQPSDSVVKTQVINGGGPMPAFGKQGILTTKQINDVAAYVAAKAGQ
jgi:cytochrome c6